MNDSDDLRSRVPLEQTMNGARISLHYPEEQQISVLDVVLIIARYRRLIGITVIVSLIVGFILAIMPEEPKYQAEATVIREATANATAGGNMPTIRGFNFGISGSGVGLTAETYPDILLSREVRLSVVRDTFYVSRWDSTLQLVSYLNQPLSGWERFGRSLHRYTIGLPALLLSAFDERDDITAQRISSDSEETVADDSEIPATTPLYLTAREERAIREVAGLVSTSIDNTTGLMTIRATTDDPQLSADIILSFLRHLDERVRAFHTHKARQNLAFVQERLEQAESELSAAESVLAQFMDRNTALQSARLMTEAERLQRLVRFKAELYGGLQSQLTQAEIELQRSEPVITVMERPVPPRRPRDSNNVLLIALSLFFGAAAGLGLAFILAFADRKRADEGEKWDEIHASFSTPRILRRFRRREHKRRASEV